MGKRKERRLAALSNAGRRLKLDLFAEPSGDLGGSSVNDKVGGDIDPTQRAGLPNSPLSSGQQPQNPLLLLGQYSDDELDEESSKGPNHAITENSLADHNDQDVPLSEGKNTNVNAIEDLDAQMVEQQDVERDSTAVDVLQSLEGGGTRESDATACTDTCREMDSLEKISVAGTSNAQVIGDVSLGWRIVMHEESNQYYYWNTETGETSWEVPDVLVQITQLTSDQKTSVTENAETGHVGTNDSSSTLGVELDNSPVGPTIDGSVGTNLIPQSKEIHGNGLQMDEWVEGYKSESLNDKSWVADGYQSELQGNLSAVSAPSGDGSLVVSEYMHGMVANDEHKRGIDYSSNLMKQCECLLEKLKSLKRYDSCRQGHDRMSKYILEVEIRLSDIKSLSSCGSSLLPFWAHSERQLQQLEDAINNEIYQLAVSAQMDDDVEAATDSSFQEKKKSQENLVHESEADGYESNGKSESSPVSINVENDSHKKADYGDVYAGHVPSLGSPSRDLGGGATVSEEVNGTAQLKPEVHVIEDVDMDVDMEVEDGVPSNITVLGGDSSTKDFASQLIQSIPPAQVPCLATGDASTIPPPPEEEWIPPPPPDNDQVPPPPPDNEQVPPPPPDEPPESSYPPVPSYTETGQPHTYTEQYNFSYPDSNFQYYGHAAAIPSSNLYGHTDGSQVAVPHASLYFEAVPNTYTETAPVIVSPVETVAYYHVQDGSVPIMPSVSCAESSQLHVEPGSVSYDTVASDQNRRVGNPAEAEPNVKLDVLAVGDETDLASTGLPSTSTTTQAAATTNVKDCISSSTINAVTATAAVPAPSAAAKVQTKVIRSKKRTVAVAPSLRSNKKVSSLVDKWKAAKEELNENEEDEPDNAYEILEKKRQREIEKWHAKQIASGEAKDNANFQPLGGDWRERVKRRRAQTAKEVAVAQKTPEASADENQQLDIEELSRGLPSGWQAYWDDASKQVYYGNVMTSETTWIRPTK